MKKLLYLLLLIPFVSLQSCSNDQEETFDKPSSERLEIAIQEYRTVLTGAENGWVMQYYPESHQAYGGINILVKFDKDGLTTMASEMGVNGVDAETATSTYDVIAETGAVLTFDTYNKFIHIFADPNPGLTGSVDGFKGDYEFVIVSATASKIEMRGKKSQNIITMIALDKNTNWADYLANIAAVGAKSQAPGYQLYLGAEAISTAIDGMTFMFDWAEGTEIKTAKVSYIYTIDGIKFYQPIAVKGKTIQNFKFNFTTLEFEGTDGVDAKIVFVYPPFNETFALTQARWNFNYATLNPTMKTLWDNAKAACFAGEGETLGRAYIGYFKGEEKQGLGFGFITDAYQAVTSANFVPVKDTEDQITFVRTNIDLLNYSYYVPYFDPFVNFIVSSSPFRMTPDNVNSPTTITFTSVANPNATFTLSK